MAHQSFDNLLDRYLDGTASEREVALVDAYLINLERGPVKQRTVQEEQALQLLMFKRIKPGISQKRGLLASLSTKWIKIAAAAIIIISASTLYAIYNFYWKDLFYQAEAILGDEILAQDCVQEVFLSLWKKRTTTEIIHLGAYLKKAVRFQALWLIRNKKISKNCYERIAQISTELMLHEPLLFKELEAVFYDVFNSLPADAQEIFKLVREEGLTYKQIAELKGISTKTVERKMAASTKELQQKLGELLPIFAIIYAHSS